MHYRLGDVPEWQWNINKEKETGMRQVILERDMFEKVYVNMVWEDLLDTLGVDQVRINPIEDPDDMEYPEKVELTVTQVRVVE